MLKRFLRFGSDRGTILCLLLPVSLCAQYRDAGTTAFDFVNVNYDARKVALAGAAAALPNDCYGVFSNPAALGYVATLQAAAGYRSLGVGVFGTPLAYAFPARGAGVFGISAYGLTSGNIDATGIGPDGGPVYLGDVARAQCIAGNVSWAKAMNGYCSAGITGKGLYTYLKGVGEYWSADGIAFDAGMQFRFMNAHLIYGFVARNIGFLRSGFEKGDDYPLPAAVEFGVSYVPQQIEDLRVIFDISKRRDDYLTLCPAAEWEIIKNQMVVRGGYSINWRDLQAFKDMLKGEPEVDYYKSSITGLCLGAGFYTEIIGRKTQFDVALELLTVSVVPSIVISMLVNL
jgi:hypothetical protein